MASSTTSQRTMARREHNTIVTISALLTFVATLSGMLILLEPRPIAAVTPVPGVALPNVEAAPPVQTRDPVPPAQHLRHVERTLRDLGVDCAYGDCYPDS